MALARHTNDRCTQLVPNERWEHAVTVLDGMNSWEPCGEPTWTRTLRDGTRVRINTPMCEKHAREFAEDRMRNREAWAGS